MKRQTQLLGALVSSAALVLASTSDARPGGGSSFKGSSSRPSSGGGSSYRSSSSGSSYRSSSGSSYSSSGSSYRSSSGSSYSSSGSSYSTSGSSYSGGSGSYTHTPQWAIRAKGGKRDALVATTPGMSLYGAPKPAPLIPMGKDTETSGERAAGFIFGGGLFAGIASVLGMPLLLVGLIVSKLRKSKGLERSWSSGQTVSEERHTTNPAHVRRQFERQVRSQDPDFSTVIFDDFLAALYTEAHVARSSQALERYSPYMRQIPRQTLASLGRSVVSSVIVGAMRPYHFNRNDAARTHRITMEIEANYTEIEANGQSQAYYACERWTLQRAMGTRSRPPAKARALVCPNCGAPLEKTVHGRCMYCSQAVDSGQFDWVVERIEVVSREKRGPMLTGTTEEQGTSSPTVYDAKLRERHEELLRVDPSFTRDNIEARVGAIFSTMQVAWSSLEWQRARPYLTDRLWNAQTYWIEAYRQQGLRNITENARITNIELVRVAYDKWYQAITVRIHAANLDYTIQQSDGQVVGGSRTKERPYTEYWTLVRSTARKNNAEGKPACPACGAPLPVEMVDKCRHCGALVESSAFDWVLSRIEQDEVYGG